MLVAERLLLQQWDGGFGRRPFCCCNWFVSVQHNPSK